jgi:Domain of unknown function (DUF4304)
VALQRMLLAELQGEKECDGCRVCRKMDAAVAAVSSLLRGHGFRKQRHRFNAEPEPGMTQVLTFQMGAHQPPGTAEIPGLRENLYGAFTINLGLHFEEVRELPTRSPAAAFLREHGLPVPRPRPRPKGLGEGDCHVTVRLGELIDGRDTWWTLDLPDDELESLVHELIADYALPFFEPLQLARGAPRRLARRRSDRSLYAGIHHRRDPRPSRRHG